LIVIDGILAQSGPVAAPSGDAAKIVTFLVENASALAFNGATRVQYITVTPDTLITKGSPVKTPQGEITPINEWRRAK
jgi:hypothetical protein